METQEKPVFRSLPKPEEFKREITDYLNKNVQDLIIPPETNMFEFNLHIAKFEEPLECVAITNNSFRGILKTDLRRKVFKTLKTQPGKKTKIRLFFWVAAKKESEVIPQERKRRLSHGFANEKDCTWET